MQVNQFRHLKIQILVIKRSTPVAKYLENLGLSIESYTAMGKAIN